MSALEIVLVSVLGSIIAITIIGILMMRALQENKANSLNLLNTHSEKNKTVFFGDSLTDFYPLQEFFPACHIYNRGVANDMSSDLLRRMANVTELNPDKLFLLIGSNDLGNLVRPEKVIENIDKIINLVRMSNPDVKIHIISLTPVLRAATLYSLIFCKFRTNKKLMALSTLQKAYCEQKGYTFIDIWDALADEKGRLKREYTIEGMHLSIKGYIAVSDILRPYITE